MLAVSLVLTSLLAGSAFAAPRLTKRAIHEITVGADNELKFNPPAVFADIGDEVHFKFTTKNHSVVQSSFAHPCGPLAGGFNTGFQFVAAGTSDFPVVKYTVQTEKSHPVWFYCSQAIHTPNAHCSKGMVFAINCPAEGPNSLDNFVSKAIAAPEATAAVTEPYRDVIVALPAEPTYGDSITIAPLTPPETKTQAVTLGASTWQTVYASYPGSPEPTPASEEGKEIKVLVGKDGGLTFDPWHVVALPRDTIVFEFLSKNHTVTQSSFAAPCAAFRSADAVAGIDSGFLPFTVGTAAPTFRVKINDTTPKYFYCKQGNGAHCGAGMVFSVNTDEQGARSFNAFQTLAKQLNVNGPPTGNNPNGTPPPGDSAAVLGASFGGVALAAALATIAALAL